MQVMVPHMCLTEATFSTSIFLLVLSIFIIALGATHLNHGISFSKGFTLFILFKYLS